MRHFISVCTLLCLLFFSNIALAQGPSQKDRENWMKEMQQYKDEFIAKKLNLSDEQRAKFLPVYDKMDQEIRRTQRDVRRMCQRAEKGEKISDVEYEKCAEALYELKGRENKIEMKYFKEFKNILSSEQLFKLKQAEMDFSRQLMKDRQNHRGAEKKRSRN